MKNTDLTNVINRKINHLKKDIEAFPKGGDFISLRGLLGNIQGKIQNFEVLLDSIEEQIPAEKIIY